MKVKKPDWLDNTNSAMNAPEVLEELDRALSRGAQEVARLARKKAPKAFSTLTHSIQVVKLGVADYEVGSGIQHAPYVEFGTGPGGAPPFQTLADWVKVHNITPKNPALSQRNLVKAIQHSIATKGSRPQPFLHPAFEEKKDRLQQLVAKGVETGLRRVLERGKNG